MRLAFTERSQEAEIIDDMRLDPATLVPVLRNLETINRFLGGFATTLGALTSLLPPGCRRARVLDVGAGGGDMARRLVAWGRQHSCRLDVVTLDLSHGSALFARDALRGVAGASVVQADAFVMPFADATFDVVVCALFLHHFRDDAAVAILCSMLAASRYGVIVNDLHRHPLAWLGIRALCGMFGAHPIVRHDAALSVRRGFRRDELAAIGRRLGIATEIQWRWAFRYRVVLRKSQATRAITQRIAPRENFMHNHLDLETRAGVFGKSVSAQRPTE